MDMDDRALDFLDVLIGNDDQREPQLCSSSADSDVLLGDGLELLFANGEALGATPFPDVQVDDTFSATGAVAKVSVTPNESNGDQKRGKASRRRVDRQKEELEYLRREVAELETHLQQVKAKSEAETSEERQEASLVAIQPKERLWERLANRQKEERRRAEIENEKLRSMLTGQLQVAHSLERVLRKRATPAVLDPSVATTSKRLRPEDTQSSDSIFAMLSDELDGIYATLDSVRSDTGVGRTDEEQNEAEAKLDDAGNVFMELRHAVVVPFSHHRTSDAMWKFLSLPRQQIPNGYMTAGDCTEDTVRMKVYVTLRLRRSEALVCVHLLVRRFVEEDRVVLVSSSYGLTEGSMFGGRPIQMRETNWTVIKPVASSDDCSEAAIVQTILRMTPTFVDFANKKSQLEMITDLVIGSYAQNMKSFVQVIENLLLEDTLGGPTAVVR